MTDEQKQPYNEPQVERKTIKIGEKDYFEDTLPSNVKQLIQIYSQWNADVVKARLKVSKNEAAIRDIFREILEAVQDLDPVKDLDPVNLDVSDSTTTE